MAEPTTQNVNSYPVFWIYDSTLFSGAGGYRPAATSDFSGGGGGGGSSTFTTVTPLTVGATYAAGKAVQINCTTAGNVSLQMNGAANVVPVLTGLTILPYGVTVINSSGTTATATYANLS